MKCNYLLIADKFLNATSCVCKLLQKPTKILAFSTGLFIQYPLMLKPILAHSYLPTKSADKYNRQINMQIYVRQIRLTGANAIRMLVFCSLSGLLCTHVLDIHTYLILHMIKSQKIRKFILNSILFYIIRKV